ncbi:hypothetical protein ES689_13295 [Frigoribacterium sp. ACAM 257]|uniref:hypothetical protein n=1 Tax=Frigoribacterium sp. ACAM 257 TaxID=2508998 RepID=UPI0011B998FF|nr:hypothetical protein [Frigoribacterium sp. ACAM 257]TWX35553.1 hypothetical protein ES689_13295 [Frigoribacterium sp. ACAM 257]
MTSFRLVAHVVAPVGGAVFVTLWTVAEAGRSGLAGVVTVATTPRSSRRRGPPGSSTSPTPCAAC